jgi:HAE1 family hydrophobic/amphiphilic exporter-1
VFFPIVFVTGIAGQIFRDQSLTVCYSLMASLFVAMFVTPALAGITLAALGQAVPLAATRAMLRRFVPPAAAGRFRRIIHISGRLFEYGMLAAVGGALLFYVIVVRPESGLEREEMGAYLIRNAWLFAPYALLSLLTVPTIDVLMLMIRYVVQSTWFFLGLLFKPLGKIFDLGWKVIEETYPLAMRLLLPQPLAVVALAMLLGVSAAASATALDTELLPTFQQGEYYADAAAPEGTKIDITDAEARRLIARAFENEGLKANIARISSETGGEGQAGDWRELGSHRTRLVVTLKAGKDPREVIVPTQNVLREQFSDSAHFQGSGEFSAPALFSLATGIEVEIRGPSHERLGRVAEALVKALKMLKRENGEPLLFEVQSSLSAGRPQIALAYDRELLERYKLTAEAVTRAVRIKIGGQVSTSFSSRGEDIDVFVELGGADKDSVDRVLEIEVAPGVRLKDVLPPGARPTPIEGPSEIRRVGNERAVIVRAQPNGVALSTAKHRIEQMLASKMVDLDGSSVRFSGQASEMEESVTSLLLALALAIFLVYVVMAVQFENLIDPLIIMFSVPFAGVGVVATLIVFRMPVSIMVLLGVIVLAGVVVNNAIVLVDYANLLQSRGMKVREAALAAGKIRLRPIAITTLTTLLGLLPMTGWLDPFMPVATAAAKAIDSVLAALAGGIGRSLTAPSEWPLIGGSTLSCTKGLSFLVGGGEGAEVRKPLAITVIVGLTSSTLLTLFVIPTVWAWVNKRRDKVPAEAQGSPVA